MVGQEIIELQRDQIKNYGTVIKFLSVKIII